MKEIQKLYQKEMDKICYKEEEKEKLTAKLQQETPLSKRKIPVPKRTLVAVAMLICTVSACAYGVLHTGSEAFAPLYGTNENILLDEIGQPIGVSDTDNGITVTANAVVGDANNVFMIYTMEKNDHSPIELSETDLSSLYFKDTDVRWYNRNINVELGVQNIGCRFVQQENNRLSFIYVMHTQNPIPNEKWIKAKFTNLCRWDAAEKKDIPIIEGTWTLRYKLDYIDSGITIPVEQTFTKGGIDFTVKNITLSPIAAHVEYTANDIPLTWKTAEEKEGFSEEEIQHDTTRFIKDIEWFLTKKDGTTLSLAVEDIPASTDKIPTGGSHLSPETTYSVIQRHFGFSSIIPLDEIASITVGNIVIDIP